MSVDYLTAAIEVATQAALLIPKDYHPVRVRVMSTLASAILERSSSTGSMDDFREAMEIYEQIAQDRVAPPAARIKSARQAARLQYSQNLIKPACRLLTTAVCLLPAISPRILRRRDQQFELSQRYQVGLAADASALAIRVGEDVSESLRLLELGRGVMATVHLEMCSDVAELSKEPGSSRKI